MPGVDEQYIKARRVLLDALDALQDHRNALILVGAHAIYLHTGAANLGVAEFTTDADLALDPMLLATAPPLEKTMLKHGFKPELDQFGKPKPGIWRSVRDNVEVDLMVPDALGGPGRRGVDLEGHDHLAARKARGLEAALLENQLMTVSALDVSDPRSVEMVVAGPTALLIAKLHKIHDRQGHPIRQDNKDAFDAYRLLTAIPLERFMNIFPPLLADYRAAEVTRQAIVYLRELFAADDALGSQMAARYLPVSEEERATVAASCAVLAQDILAEVEP